MPVFLLIAACCAIPLAAGAAMVFKTLRSAPETGISPNAAVTPDKQTEKLPGKSQPAEGRAK